jgi:hypothetical protein
LAIAVAFEMGLKLIYGDRVRFLVNGIAGCQFTGNNMRDIEIKSLITCPYCGEKTEELMPVDYCQVRYECPHCHDVLRPLKGDCCIFCSFGSEKCPSMQSDENLN